LSDERSAAADGTHQVPPTSQLTALTHGQVPSRRDRFAALDGLRGLSIAVVIVFHAGFSWARGGSVGVDVFFVLSGFLITLLLMQEWGKNRRISLGRFYARRALRLYPALLLVVGAVLIYAKVAAHPVGTRPFSVVIWGPLLYLTDLQGASGHIPGLTLTEHTWSLAIEEQFYLAWPPLLALLLAFGARARLLLGVVLGLAAASAVLTTTLWSGAGSLNRVYSGPDTRAQALLLGCALGLATSAGWLPSKRWVNALLQFAGLAGVTALVAYTIGGSFTDAWNYTGYGLLLMALAAVAVIAAAIASPKGPISRVLALPPLVGLGKISYGLYLWHWPIFLVLNSAYLRHSFLQTQIIRLTVTLVVTLLSYWLIEKPFLRLRHRFQPKAHIRRPVAAVPAAIPA
jgi:peptidoglycan/LPS O-acetylase OafA/YrhL